MNHNEETFLIGLEKLANGLQAINNKKDVRLYLSPEIFKEVHKILFEKMMVSVLLDANVSSIYIWIADEFKIIIHKQD